MYMDGATIMTVYHNAHHYNEEYLTSCSPKKGVPHPIPAGFEISRKFILAFCKISMFKNSDSAVVHTCNAVLR